MPFAFTAIARGHCGEHIGVGGWIRMHDASRDHCYITAARRVSIGSPRAHGVHEYCVAGSTRSMDSHSLTFATQEFHAKRFCDLSLSD